MDLLPFDAAVVPTIAGWARGREELSSWAALDAPPTEQTFRRWHRDPDVRAFLLVADAPVAYGEVWISEPEDEAELARLIVAPARRGQGLGRELVSRLIAVAERSPVSTAWVRVVPDNHAALRCYEACGFAPVSASLESRFNQSQPRIYRWLRRPLSQNDGPGSPAAPN